MLIHISHKSSVTWCWRTRHGHLKCDPECQVSNDWQCIITCSLSASQCQDVCNHTIFVQRPRRHKLEDKWIPRAALVARKLWVYKHTQYIRHLFIVHISTVDISVMYLICIFPHEGIRYNRFIPTKTSSAIGAAQRNIFTHLFILLMLLFSSASFVLPSTMKRKTQKYAECNCTSCVIPMCNLLCTFIHCRSLRTGY